MPRERLPLRREHKGDVTINIVEIFRNEEMQNEAIKGCKKLKPQTKQCNIPHVSNSVICYTCNVIKGTEL